jgi:hypothetical protein
MIASVFRAKYGYGAGAAGVKPRFRPKTSRNASPARGEAAERADQRIGAHHCREREFAARQIEDCAISDTGECARPCLSGMHDALPAIADVAGEYAFLDREDRYGC